MELPELSLSFTRDRPDADRDIPTLAVVDPERLAALESYGVLDTDPEEAFDDIVSVAANACDAPCALISLVAAERQWFKAKVGFEGCETPIEQSVCAHALGERDMLIIPDLTLDPRTSGNPLVTGAEGLRFYAGAVLRTSEGQALGSLCVVDVEPRPAGLTERQQDVLKTLARQVMRLLDMRKTVIRNVDAMLEQGIVLRQRDAAVEALSRQELKLRLAIDATRMGIFDYDLVSGQLHWDDRVRELFGISSTAPVTYETSFLAGVHPDDREAADRAVKDALDPSGPGVFEHEYRTVAPDGAVRWLAARGQSVTEGGEVIRFVGTARDVTARRTVDDQIAATLERYSLVSRVTKDVIWDWDLVTHHVIWNDALTSAYGYRASEVEPTPDWWFERIHPDDMERTRLDIFSVIDGRERDWSHEYRFRRADGAWAEVFDRGSIIRDQTGRPLRMIGAMFDNSERKADEERQRLLNHELSHRMKNLLTMAQGIVGQTLRNASSMSDAQALISGRLVALGKAHEILLQGKTAAAQLSALIEEAIRPHVDGPSRMAVSGPKVEIGAKSALSVVLMFHELATNAAKYGSLSNADGRIDVSWSIAGPPDGKALKLAWTEHGGPSVSPPQRAGFGTNLISRGLAGQLGATVRMDFLPQGLVCGFEAPLDRLGESD